jgi:hypothetical protein
MKLPHFLLSYGLRLNPVRDWNVLMTLVLTTLLIIVGWNAWLFKQVAGGASFGSVASAGVTPLNQTKLDALAEVFTSRASEQLKYKDGTHHFIDPSK